MDPVGEELERLARLRASGHLSNDEFEALKARLLSGPIEEDIVESESLDDEPLSEAAEPGVEDAGGVEPPVLDDSPPSAMDEEVCLVPEWQSSQGRSPLLRRELMSSMTSRSSPKPSMT